MHNAQAVLRAVESGRWLVRAANTGISSIITPTGKVMAEIGADREGYLCQDAYMRDGLTLYSKIGNLFVLLCGVFLAAVPTSELVLGWREKKRKPS